MKALVTGATGLVGAHIVRALLHERHAVVVVVRPDSNRASIEGLPVAVSIGDVLQRETIMPAAAGCDVIFHAAAYFDYWSRGADELENTAVTGTANILAVAKEVGVRRVVLTSSSVVGGYSLDGSVRTEREKADDSRGESAYVISKIKQESQAVQRARALDLELIVARPTMTVGPFGVRLGPSNAIITMYLGDPLKMTYPGGANLVAAADVGRGHVLLAQRGTAGEVYLLGSDNLTWEQIHRLIADLSGTSSPFIRANHTLCVLAAAVEEIRATVVQQPPITTRAQAKMVGRYYWYSSEKASQLGYAPRSSREALASSIAWLAASSHVSRETRIAMRLRREVFEARRRLAADELALRHAE